MVGNTFTASGSSLSGMLDKQFSRRDFSSFICSLYLFPFLFCLLSYLIYFFVLFHSYCSHAQVLLSSCMSSAFTIGILNSIFNFSLPEILITFAIMLLVKSKTIIIIVVYPNPSIGTNISMQSFKNIFIKYL